MVISSEDGTDPVDAEFALEWGITPETAREMRLSLMERMGSGVSGPSSVGSSPEGSFPETPADQTAGPVWDMVRRALRIVLAPGSYREQSDRLKYLLLTLRWFDELGGIDNPTALAAALGVTKSNVVKHVKLLRDVLPPGLAAMPAMPGQRDAAACATFAAKRREQQQAKRQAPGPKIQGNIHNQTSTFDENDD